jgi:ABC-type multidrug transport system ATPase subunit
VHHAEDSKQKQRKKSKLTDEDMGGKEGKQRDTVKKEKQLVEQNEKRKIQNKGLRVVGIEKIYRKLPFGWKSKNDVHAVKGVWLEVPDKELLCLLGHNGAGKSTLFNMLTGITGSSKGYANIYGYDTKTQQEKLRKVIGIVPQFDILWGELTAAEHIRMFCRVKMVKDELIDDIVEDLLSSVGLSDVANAATMTFSGGMKRRLSVAIAAIGNPKIIFFDEPTTGMDPVSRKDVWTLIQRLKKNKAIVLTTHAMEEADILSDRIAVISDGKLQCIGTPLYLKNTFGDGYRISMVCDPGQEDRVVQLMDTLAPSNKIVDESGGNVVFSVPITNITEISPLFKLMEEGDQD